MTIQEINRKLEELREQYRHVGCSSQQIIRRQARALQIAKEKILERKGEHAES